MSLFLMMLRRIFIWPLLIWMIYLPVMAHADKKVGKDCSFKGKALKGKVQIVQSFPDIKVQVVQSFPDLKVKWVQNFPDKCGQWQAVESFPDFKIQMVESFPDLKVQFVESFPGLP